MSDIPILGLFKERVRSRAFIRRNRSEGFVDLTEERLELNDGKDDSLNDLAIAHIE